MTSGRFSYIMKITIKKDCFMEKYHTIEEVAKIADISIKMVRRHIACGNLPSEKRQNKYFISDSDLQTWLAAGKCLGFRSIFDNAEITADGQSENVNWIDISDKWLYDGWNDISYRNGYNFIDLFSGAGGLSCGLTMAGFTPVGSVEISECAVQTYKYNFFEKKGFDENVRTRDIRLPETKEELYESVKDKHIHLIVGGFPCQGFSMAGNRVVNDPRNSLYLEMLEIVKKIKPDFVVCENVEGLRSMLDGKVETKILQDYKDIGYEMNVTVLNSADYYVPQIRKRVIFMGNRIGAKNYHPKPILSSDMYITLGEGIKRFLNLPENKDFNHIFTKHSEEMQQRITEVPEGKSLFGNYSDGWKKSPWNKPSCTIKENHGGVNLHPLLPRVLTPRELAALQSFPDTFIFKGVKKDQLVQIGNAVPPLLGKAIGIAIMKNLDKIK